MICCNQLFHFTIFSVLLQYFPRNSYNFIRKTLDFRTSILILFLLLLAVTSQKEAGTKVLASQLFWIVEQDVVVEWLYYADFISFTALLISAEGDDEIEFQRITDFCPHSFLIYSRFPISSFELLECRLRFHGCSHGGRRLFHPSSLQMRFAASPRAALAASCAKWKRSNSDITRISNGG